MNPPQRLRRLQPLSHPANRRLASTRRPRRRKRKLRASFWAFFKGIAQWLWNPFPICNIAGVPVQFHSTCLIFPAGFVLWDGWRDGGWSLCGLLAVMLLMVSLSLLAHEFAHIFVAKSYGIRTRKIIFFPIGAAALMDELPRTIQETWIALAGPLTSLALAGISKFVFWALNHWIQGLYHRSEFHFVDEHLWLFMVIRFLKLSVVVNMSLGIFNLIPCYPLDGGRILRSLLAVALRKLTKRPHEAALVLATKITVRFVALPVAVCGIVATVARTHCWTHLILFPLAIAIGELEYWLMRDQYPKPNAPSDTGLEQQIQLRLNDA